MKKIIYIIVLFLSFLSCNFETPTQFSTEALNEEFVTLQGESMPFKTILETYKGQTILIDVWASWCGDCIKGMPDVKVLQDQFPDVVFLFLSEDRNQETWKRAIQKYDLKGEHYFMASGTKGAFKDFLNSNWIPRYMVIDASGNIKLFKAEKITDKRIKQNLN
jgi:thiol-disulfide isomerase/thioredoxin